MRKEDKVRLPPQLKVKLPPGYYIVRVPDEYVLYEAHQVVVAGRTGVMHRLVSGFTRNTNPARIETYAWSLNHR